MGCTASSAVHEWLDDRFSIHSYHTVFNSRINDIMQPDLSTSVNFNTAFGAPWWINFEFTGLMCEVGGIEIASCRSESSPRSMQILISQDMLKWSLVASITCSESWGTGRVGDKVIGKPGSDAVRAWGFEPPICAKFVRVRVVQTFNDTGPQLHYIRFSKDPLPTRNELIMELSDIGIDMKDAATNPLEKVREGVPTPWRLAEALACHPNHPISHLSTPSCSTYALFSEQYGRGPWFFILEIKVVIYELLALDLCAYIDSDSPKVIQVDVSRNRGGNWTFLAALESGRMWGSGHRMPCRPHPDTLEVNVARTAVGSATHRWKLPSCSLKYPQYVRITIAQTFSGRPPSLHYINFLHRVGRPRARSAPGTIEEVSRPLNVRESSDTSRGPPPRSTGAGDDDEEEERDRLGPLLKSSWSAFTRQRRGSL